MTTRTSSIAAITFMICVTLPAWGEQQYLYSPQPAPSEIKSSSPDGILVQEVEIQKGDTLFALSRKFSGHGMYFPQILLFNSINNPDLIYAGTMLKIPVPQTTLEGTAKQSTKPRSKAAGKNKKSTVSQKKVGPANSEIQPLASDFDGAEKILPERGGNKTVSRAIKSVPPESTAKEQSSTQVPVTDTKSASTGSSPSVGGAEGQRLFDTAVKAYRKEEFRSAIDLLDRFLAEHSNSPLAADASLYKAECYLKLSVQ